MDNKKTQILRLSNVFGLDLEKDQNKIALYDAMEGIVNPKDFLEYCRNQKDGIEYMNRVEKLDLLATKYKKTINDIPIDSLESQTKVTVSKFKEALPILRDNEIELEGHLERLTVQGVRWFKDEEIDRLNAIGGLRNSIYAYEHGNLFEKLYQVSVNKYLTHKKNEALTDGRKKVNQIVSKVLK